MKLINVTKKSVSNGDDILLNFHKNEAGDTVTSEVYLQLDSDVAVTATGKVDNSEDSVSLTAVNMGTLEPVSSISSAGIYLFMTGALQSLNLHFGGSADVVVKEIF